MRRSICQTEPSFAFAGEVKTWRFLYTTASDLPEGTQCKFDLAVENRPTDWEVPFADGTTKENALWVTLPNGKKIFPEEVDQLNTYSPAFFFSLPSEVKAGETFEICMGTSLKDEAMGTRAQTITQRRRPFHLYIDPKGKGDYKDPEVFTIDIRGNVVEHIRILPPSLVSKNRRFDIVVRFEDRFGNLSANAPEGSLIELSYEHLRENLNWKLFVPETGFIILPNLYFNEPGVYRIQLKTTLGKGLFFSAPIKCLPDTDLSAYWGRLHGESEKVDATTHIDIFIRHLRDELGHQFCATSPFESLDETPNDVWKSISSHVAEYNEDGRFTSMLGLQWLGDEGEGLRQMVYSKDSKPLMRKKDAKFTILKKIYKIHNLKDLLAIPSFTMAKGMETDFSEFSPEFERVVEIYNAWGSSECTEAEGNPRPIKTKGKSGVSESKKGSIRHALNQNHRFGFVAGGLDDRGVYSDLFESDQVQYSPGLTGILAIEQTRDTLLNALSTRSCLATTGPRIVLSFAIGGIPMGAEVSTRQKPGLAFNRHITGYVCGTAQIKEIIFIRNGKVHHTIKPVDRSAEFAIDDSESLKEIVLDSPDERPPFVYYYMRIEQEDGHLAWASPIWIDLEEGIAPPPLKKGKKK